MPEETITITKTLAQGIINYLANRPYVEVAGLIGELQTQANAQDDKAKAIKKSDEKIKRNITKPRPPIVETERGEAGEG